MGGKFKDEENAKNVYTLCPIQKCEKFTPSLTADFFNEFIG